MAYQLTGQALYVPGIGEVQVELYVYNPATDTFHPSLVRSGVVEFRLGETVLTEATLTFNRRHGNKNGAFYFGWRNPPQSQGLTAYGKVTLMDASVYEVSLPVTLDTSPEGRTYIPLAVQPSNPVQAYGLVKTTG